MKKGIYGAVLAATLACAPMAKAEIVNVHGINNSSLDGNNAVEVTLAAGDYNLSFVEDTFTAFSRFSGSSGCDSNDVNCTRGWENSVKYIIGATTFGFGDGDGNGGLGPIDPGEGYFDTAELSFANSAAYAQSFTIDTDNTVVKFFLYDNILHDNRGGVSLSVSQVPLPAAFWLFGSALFGLASVARRRAQ